MIGKLSFIIKYSASNEKSILCNITTIFNSDPNEIQIYLAGMFIDNEKKEIYDKSNNCKKIKYMHILLYCIKLL